MRAAVIRKTGPASVIRLEEIADPQPGPQELLIRMKAVSVNPIDIYIRSGAVSMDLPEAYIPGCDVAGVVESVGAEVRGFVPGDRVWGSNQSLAGRQGTFSEFCCVDQRWIYHTPPSVADEWAASIALTGITAHLGLHQHAQLADGETVFVNGGTGGVGSAVIQIAVAANATVITTVGSEEKATLATELGAQYVINYRRENVRNRLEEIRADTGDIDVWFETLRTPNPAETIPHLAKRGRYLLMAGRDARPEFPVGPFYVKDLRAIGFAMFNSSAQEQKICADHLNQLMAGGLLKANIGARFSLADAAAAHQLQEDNTIGSAGSLIGKVVLTP